MTVIIPQEYDGLLLRTYLRSKLNLSTHFLTHLKELENGITVNGERVTVRYLLHAGDCLSLLTEDRAEDGNREILPVDLPLDLLFESAHIAVFNKPADMPTHPSLRHLDDTLANAYAALCQKRGVPFVFRPVGRLDRNTTGAVLVATDRKTSSFLTDAVKTGEIRKAYLAVACGELPNGYIGQIDAPICRVGDSIITRRVCGENEPGAQKALTDYAVLASCRGLSLVAVFPKTGRTHQIRVHFASIGHALLGDDLYGSPSPLLSRHALHAAAISFPLPPAVAGEVISPIDQTACASDIADAPANAGSQNALFEKSAPIFSPSADRVCVTAPLPADMAALISSRFSFTEREILSSAPLRDFFATGGNLS